MQTTTPKQYSPEYKWLKRFLHTKIGCKIGVVLGISGFNKIEALHYKFVKYYTGTEKLRRGQSVRQIEGTAKFGIYMKPKLLPTFNSRVDKGADLCASLMTGAAQNSISTPLPPKYIALSTSSLTPAHGDTTLSGETAASGLARALGTQTYTPTATLDASASYVVSKTFTNTSAGSVTVLSAALFDASSNGNLFVEGNLASSVVLAINDQITINWTVNL